MKRNYVFTFVGPPGILGFNGGDVIVITLDSSRGATLIQNSPEHSYFFVKYGFGLEFGKYSSPGPHGGFRDGCTTLLSYSYGITIVDSAVTSFGKHINDWSVGELFEINGLGLEYPKNGTGNVKLLGIVDIPS